MQFENLNNIINNEIRILLTSDLFLDWFRREKFEVNDYLIINNSIMFRDNVKTKKSKKYLGLRLLNKDLSKYEILVFTLPENFKIKRFSKIDSKSALTFTTENLESEIIYEISILGRLVFILIGRIDDIQRFEVQIYHSLFNKLILDKHSPKSVEINGKDIVINDLNDFESLWANIEEIILAYFDPNQKNIESFKATFIDALIKLKSEVHVNLELPLINQQYQNTFIDQIINSLNDNLDEYYSSLQIFKNNEEKSNLNDILRISYNFSDQALKILKMIISICDLKPIIFWTTLSEQIYLEESFNSLPWERNSKKPSLEGYINLIHGARNRVFHNILNFQNTIEVNIEGINIQAKRLRIFSDFKSKKNIFEYEDKDLIDILTEFTRSEEEYVSLDFWERNYEIMKSSIELLKAIKSSLISINNSE